jgi:tripartite-type tricarboxylate transporter receptor subunit TctC
MKRRLIIIVLGMLFFSAISANYVIAQAHYPTRVVEIISTNAAGGGLDFALQLFKPRVEKIIGQPLIINYISTGGGVAGSLQAKASKPDGYTLMASTISTLVSKPLTQKKTPFTLDDFTPIVNLTAIPQVFCVKDDSPYKTMTDFIRAAKTKKMTYATPGTFTNCHILMEALSRVAGFQAIHVPNKGTSAGAIAVMGGHLDMLVSAASGFVGPGKLRILAVAEETRLPELPDVPTLKELGYPVVITSLDALWGPKGIPNEIVRTLFDAHKKAYADNKSEMDHAAKAGEQTVSVMSGEEMKKRYQSQYDLFKKILPEIGVADQK